MDVEVRQSAGELGIRPITYWRGAPVPFITSWSRESIPPQPLTKLIGRGGTGLGLRDEHHADRQYGVLWPRMPVGRGGRPLFEGVHPLRQRQAMSRLLCQVCGGPTVGSRRDERSLFLVASPDGAPITEGMGISSPPVHAACAQLAVEHCPPLRKGWAAALVAHAPVWGISGRMYDPRTLAQLPGEKGSLRQVSFTQAALLRWILAIHLIVTLEDVHPVTDLAAVAGGGDA